jgi:starch synthase
VSDAVALFPWGDVIEDFLEPLGLAAVDFAEQMTGGWLFGYAAALQSQGFRPIIVAASNGVKSTTELTHRATATPIWLVPGTSSYTIRHPGRRALARWARAPSAAIAAVLKRERCQALIVQEYEDPRFDVLVRLGARLRLPVYATFQADIPNPLDCEEWVAVDRGEARRSLGIADDQFVAVTHGRIDIYRKGLDVLLSAWRDPGELVLIGSGEDSARFSEMLAGRSDVRWISTYSTDRSFIRRWLSAADIYVSASRVEGMPVAPLEAMACGLPIVASDAHGLSDIIGQGEASGGLLVPRGDPEALAGAIDRLRNDSGLRTRLGKAARKHVETGFALERVGQDLARLLRAPSSASR